MSSSRNGDGRPAQDAFPELLDLLSSGEPPAFATDGDNRVVFWNLGAERVLGRRAEKALGRHCYEFVAGRDVFGNRFCQAECTVVAATRRGETVRTFELAAPDVTGAPCHLNVTILAIPGSHPDAFTVVHMLAPIDNSSRLARTLDQLRELRAEDYATRRARTPSGRAGPAPLTSRETEILRRIALGLQNKEIADGLGLSPATVRNHVHNVLEKLAVHSKLEAISLAFRRGWVSGEERR
jgi:DNA-binding CsgD family transcriptional regulator